MRNWEFCRKNVWPILWKYTKAHLSFSSQNLLKRCVLKSTSWSYMVYPLGNLNVLTSDYHLRWIYNNIYIHDPFDSALSIAPKTKCTFVLFHVFCILNSMENRLNDGYSIVKLLISYKTYISWRKKIYKRLNKII